MIRLWQARHDDTLRGAAAERNKALERLASGQSVDIRPEAKACKGLRSYPIAKLHKRFLADFFGDVPVAKLSQIAIAGFRKHRVEKAKKKNLSVATVNRALSFLRTALNHAKGEGKITGEHYFDRLSKADRKKVFLEEAPSAGLRRVSGANFADEVQRYYKISQAGNAVLRSIRRALEDHPESVPELVQRRVPRALLTGT